ncbi:Glutaminase-asparaginase [Fundidesulfovibrio magnetotacticus]|uniref:Glutaminase-asparaginase n=1 Tax=Fundidesulfovibrio magnetotacticus TaxID=2730080 RepID=A0A6V8M0E5_9BACT|nr:asparaginase domain-containing protein [Fundidesulfovibrio magnetotacticus]GFK93945.1 Glutaminase-asparaginase [Fundidesulfovibrio magnetotacticus]
MKLSIYTMGGTIDKIYFDDLSTYEVGEPQAGEILKEAKAAVEFTLREVTRKDSLHLTAEDRALLRSLIEADPARHVLVTHGTDTMAETAEALRGIPGKVIVFTGALSPARFKGSDAPFNVGCAVGAAQGLTEGVYLCMNGLVFQAGKVRKNREAGRFEAQG